MILVTGGHGFLGSHLVQAMRKSGRHGSEVRVPRHDELDLNVWGNCVRAVEGVDVVIHLAARVGGIGYNKKNPGLIFYENLLMGVQLMEAARQAGVQKYVQVGTVCAYPRVVPVPFREESLLRRRRSGHPPSCTPGTPPRARPRRETLPAGPSNSIRCRPRRLKASKFTKRRLLRCPRPSAGSSMSSRGVAFSKRVAGCKCRLRSTPRRAMSDGTTNPVPVRGGRVGSSPAVHCRMPRRF